MTDKKFYVYFDASFLLHKGNLPLKEALKGPAYDKDHDLRFYFNLLNHLHKLPESKYYGSMSKKWDRLEELTGYIKNVIGEDMVNKIERSSQIADSERSSYATMPTLYKRIDMISEAIAGMLDAIRKKKMNDLLDNISPYVVDSLLESDYIDLSGYYRALCSDISTRKEMLELLYTRACNLKRLAGFAENYGISIGILTQDDPIMKDVLEDLFPNTEIIVVPDEESDFKRKNDSDLYTNLGRTLKKEHGSMQLVLVDDKLENIEAAKNGGFNWKTYLFQSDGRPIENQLKDVILDLIGKYSLSPSSKFKEFVYRRVYPTRK